VAHVTTKVPVRRDYLTVAHGQVHLRVARPETTTARRPLVCLHMSPASGLVYERLMAQVGVSRPVFAPDTPGFGASDPLPPYPSIADYAGVVAEVVGRLVPDGPVDLLGYHTGSLTAVELARQRPELVGRIVTVSMPVFTDAELVEFRRLYDREPIFTADGHRLLERWQWFTEFFGVGRHNTVEAAARIFYARLSGGERHWWGHHAAFAYDPRPALEALRTPLLVLNIADDLTEQTRRAAAYLPGGSIEEHPEWTHGFLDNDATGAARRITAFLDEDRGRLGA
jgi:pimeloyl-ACP methyl ester carboxylesterase